MTTYKAGQCSLSRGGCQMVIVLTFDSDNSSLNPAEVYIFIL